MRINACKNPKHIAWATWTILANNPINKASYMLIQVIEGLVMIYYALVLNERLHYSNIVNSYNNLNGQNNKND